MTKKIIDAILYIVVFLVVQVFVEIVTRLIFHVETADATATVVKAIVSSIITIAVHSGDPMECEAYTLGSNSYPAARVNRGELTDPYYGNSDEALGIKSLIDQELQESPLVDIGVSATWNNESQQSILITTETKYLSVAESLDYGIAYVLLE